VGELAAGSGAIAMEQRHGVTPAKGQRPDRGSARRKEGQMPENGCGGVVSFHRSNRAHHCRHRPGAMSGTRTRNHVLMREVTLMLTAPKGDHCPGCCRALPLSYPGDAR